MHGIVSDFCECFEIAANLVRQSCLWLCLELNYCLAESDRMGVASPIPLGKLADCRRTIRLLAGLIDPQRLNAVFVVRQHPCLEEKLPGVDRERMAKVSSRYTKSGLL